MTYILRKDEILKGYGVFEDVLSNSRKFQTGSITAYMNSFQPATAVPVKVGFLLSKKKLEKHTIGTGYEGF